MSRYDRRDPTRAELLLVRAIHHLWLENRKSRGTYWQEPAFSEALETLFGAKRQVKLEIREKSIESFRRWKAA